MYIGRSVLVHDWCDGIRVNIRAPKDMRSGYVGRTLEISMSIAESFGRSSFAQFINSRLGRQVRLVVGVALIAWGFNSRGTAAGVILIVVGLVPLAAGAFDLCLISALLGGPISGSRIADRNREHAR
jgi:hypothetical protein